MFGFLVSLISPFSKQSVERMKITNHVFYTKPGIYEKILHSGRVMPAGKLLEKKELELELLEQNWTYLSTLMNRQSEGITFSQNHRNTGLSVPPESNSAVVTGTARKCAIKRPQFICSL